MVKNPLVPVARRASFSSRSAVRTARIGPAGGGVSPKRLRSALENGRSQAKALPRTNHVRLPWRAASVTSGSAATIRSTSSRVGHGGTLPPIVAVPALPATVSGVSAGLDAAGLRRLHERLAVHTDSGEVPGLAALLARGGDVHVEVLGHAALDDPAPLQRDAIFRIASLTKPISAAGAMVLVDDGVLSLSDPVDAAAARAGGATVLRSLESGLDDTVPAERPITVEDLLTFRLGFGVIMVPPGTYPIQGAEAELGGHWPLTPWPFEREDPGARSTLTLPARRGGSDVQDTGGRYGRLADS